jgi:hypothetical protein
VATPLLTALLALASTIAVSTGVVVVGTARAYGAAAAGRRDRRDGCPFEDDDDEARPLARETVDVLRESAALVVLLLSALRPLPRDARARTAPSGTGPLVVLVPEHRLPRGSLLWLGGRLARDLHASLHVEPRRAADQRLRADRLAEHLASLAATAAGRPIVVVGHGAGGAAARRAVVAIGRPGVRLVTIATAHPAPDARSSPPAVPPETVNLYSLHDAIVAPSARGYLAGAYNIAVRDEGHFGLVLGARPYALLHESLIDPAS